MCSDCEIPPIVSIEANGSGLCCLVMFARSLRVLQRQTFISGQSARLLSVHNVNVPSMGDSISEGTLVEILKGKGESVQEDQVVAVLETDKVGDYQLSTSIHKNLTFLRL